MRPLLCAAAGLLLLAAGCGPPRLNKKATYAVEPGLPQVIDLPSVNKPQRVTVSFSSSAGEVSVYIIKNFKEEDGKDSPPSKAQTLEMLRGTTGTLSADVSPDTETRVIVRDARQKTTVDLTLTNTK